MDVFKYMLDLEKNDLKEVLATLFSNPWTCCAVFRSLPPSGQQIIARMLFTHGVMPNSTVEKWFKNDAEAKKFNYKAVKMLRGLRICRVNAKTNEFIINPQFAEKLKQALCSNEPSPWTDILGLDQKGPTLGELDYYSGETWEKVSECLIKIERNEKPSSISKMMLKLLQNTELIAMQANTLYLTALGYQFLLKDRYNQIWTLLIAYIDSSHDRNMRKGDVLGFLFQLSFLNLGSGYPLNSLSKVHQKLLQELIQFGLFYCTDTQYYPTRIAINLVSQTQKEDELAAQENTGFIIVETNYRMYSYTSSQLYIDIICLFSNYLYILPNLLVTSITRDSIRNSLKMGISAEQIIDFLKKNVHSSTRNRKPAVPEAIQDQIRLWEIQRNRVQLDSCMLYDNFSSLDDFLKCEKHAKEIDCYLWSSATQMSLIVSDDGHDQMLEFIGNMDQMEEDSLMVTQ